MSFLLLFVYFVSNMCLIRCKESVKEIPVSFKEPGMPCEVSQKYTINIGDDVSVIFYNRNRNNITVHFVSLTGPIRESEGRIPFDAEKKSLNIRNITKDDSGLWTMKYYILKNLESQAHSLGSRVHHDGDTYYTSKCETNITIVPGPQDSSEPRALDNNQLNQWIIIGAPIAVLVIIIMIAQTACIMYLKSQAQQLHKQTNWTKKSDEEELTDKERYSSDPGHRARKIAPPITKNRDSEIYEVPDITIGGHPLPPALPNSPRPSERGEHPTLRMTAPPPASTLRSTASHMSYPRPSPTDQDTLSKMSLAQRPPLPLPQDEFYSDPQEENTYEPPPLPEMPTRPTPQKKIIKPIAEKMGKQLPDIPMQGLKPRVAPPITNKPIKPPISQAKPTPPRNNAIQVPIRPVPGASSLKKPTMITTKPPVAKPKSPPLPPMNQHVNLVNRRQHEHQTDSSDEEWTYEPLSKYNIYNI